MTDFRPFDLVHGVVDEDQQVIHAGIEVWKARRAAMMLLKAEAEKCDENGHRDLAKHFRMLMLDFRDAAVGDLLFGYVRKWKGLDGRQHFLGVVEHGHDYRDAGAKTPPSPDRAFPTWSPTQITEKPRRLPVERDEPEQDVATRIADKMARAASAAVNKEES